MDGKLLWAAQQASALILANPLSCDPFQGSTMHSRQWKRRKRLLRAATFVLDFQRAGQAAAQAGEARTMFQGSSWSMRLIG